MTGMHQQWRNELKTRVQILKKHSFCLSYLFFFFNLLSFPSWCHTAILFPKPYVGNKGLKTSWVFLFLDPLPAEYLNWPFTFFIARKEPSWTWSWISCPLQVNRLYTIWLRHVISTWLIWLYQCDLTGTNLRS